MTTTDAAFQDRMHDNFCFGCGADNPDGLQLKSAWDAVDPEVAVATFRPQPMHAAGPRHILNGGIIGTILDCHGIGTALADAYRREERAIGSAPEIWYATASMTVDYLRPAPLEELVATADVLRVGNRVGVATIRIAACSEPEQVLVEGKGVYAIRRGEDRGG